MLKLYILLIQVLYHLILYLLKDMIGTSSAQMGQMSWTLFKFSCQYFPKNHENIVYAFVSELDQMQKGISVSSQFTRFKEV